MDERLNQINQEKQDALNNSNNVYNQMLQNNQNLYNQQNQYANTYEQTQNDILDKQLAYNTSLIEQQKEVARQNKEVEERKAKNDFTAYTNPYGLQAEQFASRGLLNSGVSETAKLGGYNTYQNRLSNANKVMQDAFLQYDNEINQARLTNDVQKAQNAIKKLELQLGFSESFYNNQNTYMQNQLTNNQNIDSEYYNRYNTMYNNIQAEKQREEQIRQWEAELAEQQRQYNESMSYKREQDALAQANWEREYALSKAAARKSNNSRSGSSTSYSLVGDTPNNSGVLSDNNFKVSGGLTGSVLGSLLNSTNNAKNSTQSNSVRANMTPILSTKNYDWYNQNFSENMSLTELNEKIAKGISTNKISTSDADKIYYAYGLK